MYLPGAVAGNTGVGVLDAQYLGVSGKSAPEPAGKLLFIGLARALHIVKTR
jgi:hypothetical protein